jgi:hypothetical protein
MVYPFSVMAGKGGLLTGAGLICRPFSLMASLHGQIFM